MPSVIPPDQSLAADIRRRTATANRNNVTRTMAYLDIYRRHPELHWAFLAHLVSRNGGWNMTDLRGDWLPRIMNQDEIKAFFLFLERSNWLIFHDAYPQLLLYEEMKRSRTDLTRLLPMMGVSRFMIPIWQDFLQRQERVLLTRALIINEQQYIHQRVVQQPFFRENVLSTFQFLAQSVLSLNQVLFPYQKHPTDKRLSVIGVAVHHFSSVHQRIAIGKTLYQLLFGDSRRLRNIRDWAFRIPHTGSRADYWPHLFSPVKPFPEEKKYRERINGTELIASRPKLYSPVLSSAWKDVEHPPADGDDWFRDENWTEELEESASLSAIDTNDYASSLNMVELGMKVVTRLT
ncbi:DUF2515 family protein [Brevibacillus sp. H7]|uniref:DUF2515 family protein n=1 Tax=Brevibacillus sp. H7 TaxID=3349138 RepID=UPI0037FA0D67